MPHDYEPRYCNREPNRLGGFFNNSFLFFLGWELAWWEGSEAKVSPRRSVYPHSLRLTFQPRSSILYCFVLNDPLDSVTLGVFRLPAQCFFLRIYAHTSHLQVPRRNSIV